ncbi:MAG: hypothetical protein JJT95_06370 [Pararhodobacter sp.]|nr:hypothetical protein [Pararhodobacter sp.]
MLRLTAIAIAIAAPAAADVAEVSNCAFLEPLYGFQMIECDITNLSETPIAALRYGVRVTEEGRTVPWHEFGPTFARVPGGIEPTETVPVSFLAEPLNERADADKLVIELVIHEAKDVNGYPITSTQQ